MRANFVLHVTKTSYITFASAFSTLGGYDAALNVILIKFAPLGMMYFLFNLAVYIREHYKDKLKHEIS